MPLTYIFNGHLQAQAKPIGVLIGPYSAPFPPNPANMATSSIKKSPADMPYSNKKSVK